MRLRKISLPLLLASAMLLSGCSLIEKLTQKSDSTSKADRDLPTDREQILLDKASKPYNPESLARGVIDGDWAIETVYGKEVKTGDEVKPFLKFVPEQQRMYGNNGCNTLNAKYTFNPQDSTLSFSEVAATMRYCPSSDTSELEINRALGEAAYYTWEEQDYQYHIYLLNSSRHQIMGLMHQNFDFLNGVWRVTAINEEPLPVTDIKLVIDVEEGKIHGYTGCNTLNGTMEVDMSTPNCISFQAFAVTKKACDPDRNYEFPLIVALEEADTARPISPTKALLLSSQGKIVLTLERTSEK